MWRCVGLTTVNRYTLKGPGESDTVTLKMADIDAFKGLQSALPGVIMSVHYLYKCTLIRIIP